MNVNNPSSIVRDKSFCNEKNLTMFLKNSQAFTLKEQQQLKYFIDNYADCWRIWNKVRWDAAMNSEGVKELKEYLGDKFVPYYDSSWELAKEWKSRRRVTKKDVEDFYRNTRNYIYNSIIFFHSGDRIDLNKYWLEIKKTYGVNSVIDFGCGVGNDGLKMLESGCKVIFSDFESPTLDFLRWRLKKRNLIESCEVMDVDKISKNKVTADMLWAVDVLEHMKNPFDIFKVIENVQLVVFFTDCDDKAGGRHPFHFKINRLELDEEFKRRNYKKIKHNVLEIWKKN